MTRLRRSDWTELALRILAEDGPESLTVARLCEVAGRTRGSLYHHFADHEALIAATLEHWAARDTDRLIAEARDADDLDRRAAALDARLELAVRRLIARAPQFRGQVSAVDARRIEHLAGLHAAAGVPEPRVVAELEYATYLGLQQLDVTAERRAVLRTRFARWLASDTA